MKSTLSLLVASTLAVSMANAGTITEIEPNSTLATAQNIENAFTGEDGNVNIYNSSLYGWETASIVSLDGDNSYDYFIFEANAGQNYVFDVDFGMNDLDAEIALWSFDGAGQLIHEQDDGCQQGGISLCSSADLGSFHSYDPRFSWNAATQGSYVVGVARYSTAANDFGFNGSAPIAGDNYTLQVSRSVPAPASIALFALGLLGLGAMRKKRTS
ncbi:PEP-CTERM sorting domain-containing protein [Psychromonas hadalis]|uniref:PEP-CTERM sorting domain-containing protein n=1 Tax=Psychromonas hadalis TaxID=211669 RepID=UPI0003B5BE0D|nr:PEP-CTERM sorting domain-containing protein [Psychromonas hadalis]